MLIYILCSVLILSFLYDLIFDANLLPALAVNDQPTRQPREYERDYYNITSTLMR